MESRLSPYLYIRADGTRRLGLGHVMRCLALAQQWIADGGTTVFMGQIDSPALIQRLTGEGIRYIPLEEAYPDPRDLEKTLAVLGETSDPQSPARPCWVVLDGYHFDPAYQQAIRQAGYRLLMLDDNAHWPEYHAHILLNQNPHAAESLYAHREPDTRLLLGTHYALLRREFFPWREWNRETPDLARKILLTMGGSDPDNVTLRVLQALRDVFVEGLEVKVIVGAANPHYAALQAEAEHALHALHAIQLEQNVTDMPALMAWADVVISASGSACWELAFMGLPSILVVLAENQLPLAAWLDAVGVALSLGWHADLSVSKVAETLSNLIHDTTRRKIMQRRGRELVDSLGSERVAGAMQLPYLHLRPARAADRLLVFQWANEPGVRAVSFSSEVISWDAHVIWFDKQLNDSRSLFFIAENGIGKPVGQVRFVLDDHQATISISLDHTIRGRGFGRSLIALASQQVFENTPVTLIHAYIKQGNTASQRAFAGAGYRLQEPVMIKERPAFHMILEAI
ncbi:MAG: UDP-2,4-diacetamido-2,4,6-trideoxy-beta-L-altropyranose hydrolase [Chloroflexi bacterium]|nr:UDP-2,4-diacetamido-2,4,6-trideoxy-beta-L-altropyranose hydrolase [Chloroflexota bacterium]